MSIYVGNLSYEVKEAQLMEVFSEYGTVKTVQLPTDKMSGKLRGFGFVEMSDDAEENAAIDALDGGEWMGRNLVVNKSKPKDEKDRDRKIQGNTTSSKFQGASRESQSNTAGIYVGNLSYGVTEDDVRSVFSKYGTLTKIKLPVDKESGRMRGFGFVSMTTEDEEASAIKSLDSFEFMGRRLTVTKAKPKEEKSFGRFQDSRRSFDEN